MSGITIEIQLLSGEGVDEEVLPFMMMVGIIVDPQYQSMKSLAHSLMVGYEK